MVALLPHRTPVPPAAKACTSHALFEFVTDDGTVHNSCGPHLYMLIGQHLAEHPHYTNEDPQPGTPCDFLEAQR